MYKLAVAFYCCPKGSVWVAYSKHMVLLQFCMGGLCFVLEGCSFDTDVNSWCTGDTPIIFLYML